MYNDLSEGVCISSPKPDGELRNYGLLVAAQMGHPILYLYIYISAMTTGPPPSQVFRPTRHVELPAPRPSGSTHNDNDEDNGNDCHDISIIMAIVIIIIIGIDTNLPKGSGGAGAPERGETQYL
jgi:hypothetical protein